MRETAARIADELDPVWKALSDPTRRAILDLLRDRPRTTTGIVESFPHLTRFGVMKHLEVLRQSQLVRTRDAGRQRVNSLNVVPIRQIYERWVGPFQELWSGQLLQIRDIAERQHAVAPKRTLRKLKNRPPPVRKPGRQRRNRDKDRTKIMSQTE